MHLHYGANNLLELIKMPTKRRGGKSPNFYGRDSIPTGSLWIRMCYHTKVLDPISSGPSFKCGNRAFVTYGTCLRGLSISSIMV